MRAVLQRVSKAEILIDKTKVRKISYGLVVLLCVMESDSEKEAEFLAKKIAEMRIFSDENDKLNLSITDIDGDMLIVSNFTLGAKWKKGRRPSFAESASPSKAKNLYSYFVECMKKYNIKNIKTGEFGADMQINLINDGPVTIMMDTEYE